MLEAYSTNIDVATTTPVPFETTTIQKGQTAVLMSPSSIALNKCGVYMVSVNASSEAESTIELTKDGIVQPQAQSSGTNPCFTTLVQVPNSNTNCCCSSPTLLQLINTGAAAVFTNVNIVVTKVC